jgi:hypothetical protein
MPWIKFIETPKLPDDIKHLGYKLGTEVELTRDQAERWLRRGVAEIMPDKFSDEPRASALDDDTENEANRTGGPDTKVKGSPRTGAEKPASGGPDPKASQANQPGSEATRAGNQPTAPKPATSPRTGTDAKTSEATRQGAGGPPAHGPRTGSTT